MIEEPEPAYLLLIFASFFFSAFFSASEIAVLSISEAKMRALLRAKKRGARTLEKLKKFPEKLITTILIGNNLANIAASVLVTVFVERTFGAQFLAIATGILTFFILIFGEILPKTFAQNHAARFSLFAALPIYIFEKILFPIIWILSRFSKIVQKKKKISEEDLENEILALAEIGEERGALQKGEKNFIENLLEFSDTTIGEVQTPRVKIDALNENTPLNEAIEFAISHSHTRLPVFRETLDEIVGIVAIRDLLQFSKQFSTKKKLEKLKLRAPFFLPKTKKTSAALRELQKNKTQMAIVVDEHGGVSGLVTIEDLVEEIFGEIEDESDVREIAVKKISQNSFRANADLTCGEFLERAGFSISANDEKKIALLILEKIERLPKIGERIIFENFEIFIEKMRQNRIEKVRIIFEKSENHNDKN